MIATSIEQSKQLLKLKVKRSSADLWYHRYRDDEDRIRLDSKFPSTIMASLDDIPAWSLSALLQLLPFPVLWQEMYGGALVWRCQITFMKTCEKHLSLIQETPFDAVLECVIWLAENNLL